MSAFICSDSHIATIAYYVGNHFNIDTQELANKLKSINIESVNYRYNEKTCKSKCKLVINSVPYSNDDVAKLIKCWDYQSCEKITCDHSAYRELLFRWVRELNAKPDNGKYWTI